MLASRCLIMAAFLGASAVAPGMSQEPSETRPESSNSTHFATVGGWNIFDQRGSCSAITTYDGDVTVRVEYDYGTDLAEFFIANPAWESVQSGATYRVSVSFNNGSDYTDSGALGIRIDHPSGRLTGVAMSFDGSDFMEDFALAGAVELHLGGTRLDRLSLRGTRAVTMRLIRCATASFRRFPPDPFARVAPTSPSPAPRPLPPNMVESARARANLPSYVSNDDYPASALRNAEQGTTAFRLTVGPNGRVTDCVVTSSSGSTALDNATCRIMRSRARFTPARDNVGNPITDIVSSSLTWRLEDSAAAPSASFLDEPSRHWVQIAAGADRAYLSGEAERLRNRAPALLAGRQFWTARLNLTNRLLVGPFSSAQEARDLVDRLALDQIAAFAWTSPAGQPIMALTD